MKRRVAALVMALVFCVSSMSVTAAEPTETPVSVENEAKEEPVKTEEQKQAESEETELVSEETIAVTPMTVGEVGSEKLVDRTVDVKTPEELIEVMAATTITPVQYKNLTINIKNDINLSGEEWTSAFVNGYNGAETYTINGENHKITGLNGALVDGTWAGKGKLIINDLTIGNSTMAGGKENEHGFGAFVGHTEATSEVTLNNCHLLNCTLRGADWTGGFIGYAAGYDREDDGPVTENISIIGCSVKQCEIIGGSSTGAIFGHATGNVATHVKIEDCVIEGNTITCTDNSDKKAGSVMGTVGVGDVTVINAKVQNNQVQSGGVSTNRAVGRFGNAGTLNIQNGEYLDCRKAEFTPPDTVSANGTLNGLDTASFKGVAKVGDTEYGTLAEAIEVGGTVTLLADVAEDITIPAGKTITLDLNGKTLTNVSNHTIVNSGVLNIIDSSSDKAGKVDNVTHQKAAIDNMPGGVVTLNGGEFTRSKENGSSAQNSGGNSFYTIRNHGDMTINSDVKVTQNGGFSSMIENGWYDGAENTGKEESVLKINGGSFDGGLNTVKNDDYGKLFISGGTFENTKQAVILNWNVAEITGGTFTTQTGIGILNKYGDATMDQGKLNITGGTFKITGTGALLSSNYTASKTTISGGGFYTADNAMFDLSGGASVEVSGGYYSNMVEPFGIIAEGKECVKGTYWENGYQYSYKVVNEDTMCSGGIDPKAPENNVADTIKDDSTKGEAANIVKVVFPDEEKQKEFNKTLSESVAGIHDSYASNPNATEKAAQNAGLTIGVGDTLVTTVKPYLVTEVKDIITTGEDKQVKLDIKMLYDVVASVGSNEKILVQGQKISDEACKPVEISFQIPDGMFELSQITGDVKLYVEHTKEDGSVWHHIATLTEGTGYDTVTFLNDKGYSDFVLKLGTVPADRPAPTPTPTPTPGTGSSSSSSSHSSSSVKTVTAAKTGDTTNVWTPMLMMLAALAVSGGCVVYSRKKKQAEQ